MARYRAGTVLVTAIVAAVVVVVLTSPPSVAVGPGRCGSGGRPLCTITLPTGVTLAYEQVGPARGPVTFLLHGFADSTVSWSRVLPRLHRLMPRERIIVPDLRGQGASSQPSAAECAAMPQACFRPIDFAADVLALMDADHIARADFVGHSAGSLVAQELALDHPQRVGRLVLIGTGTDGQQPLVKAIESQLVEGEWRQDFVAAGYDWPKGVYDLLPSTAVPDFTGFVNNEFETSTIAPATLLAQLQAGVQTVRLGAWIGTVHDLVLANNTARLKRLRVPTLVLWGVQDDIFSRDAEQKLIDTLDVAAARGTPFWWKQYGVLAPPHSGAQTDLGHSLPWEAPTGLARDAASFLLLDRPTCTQYRSDYPSDIHRVRAVPGAATVIHAGPGERCTA